MARATLVIRGDVLLAASPAGAERAEAIGIADGRVVAAGTVAEVGAAATPGAELVDAGGHAVIPGLHDFHIHLVGLARARSGVLLDDAADGADVVARVAAHAVNASGAWLSGRGWSERHLAGLALAELDAAAAGRPTVLSSHDGHSAWASSAALAVAGVTAAMPDPAGGRIERDAHGEPTGVLRETAMDLVSRHAPELQGEALRDALDATLRELAMHGLTGASEAGDYTDEGGTGTDAAFGDSYSTLTDLGELLDGRLRMTLGIPADAIDAAAARGLRTGDLLAGRDTLRFGWAKEYADGALGSGTAALFEPRTCGEHPDTGIMRVTPADLDDLLRRSRAAGIGMAIHAIGDRAASTVLDAVERAAPRGAGVPSDRMEHLQLLRPSDARRLAALGVTASIQPIHAAADRDLVERCWDGRQDDAYAWRGLVDAGALLAAGSDAPIESVSPWLGIHAALHRRFPTDDRDDWRPDQALTVLEALHAFTLGPAAAIGAADEGHLRPGAHADVAILSVGLDALLGGAVRWDAIRSERTLVGGRAST
jgi:predicted amidohydrolase YtcJ